MVKQKILAVLVTAITISLNCFAGVNFWSGDSTLEFSDSAKFYNFGPSFEVNKGTISREDASQILGFPLYFEHGTFADGDLNLLLTAAYDFDEVYGVVLDGGKSFKSNSGIFTSKILVYGQDNDLEGQPIFLQDSAIKMQDYNTTLTIGIQNALTTSIMLNNGTIFLTNDLRLADDIQITTSGIIRCYSHKVTLGSKPLYWSDPAGTLVWSDFPVVELTGTVTLAGRWAFNSMSSLSGNGNVLDLSGGTIRVNGSGPLYISNIKLKGLGTGKFEFDDPAGQIRLSNVEIEMNSDYTFTYGGVYVEGPATVVTKHHMLTFDYGSSMTVDGVALNYETLSVLDSNNIQPSLDQDLYSTRIALINAGLIRRIQGVQVGPLVLNPEIPGDTVRISQDIAAAPTKEIVVVNDVTFNGSSNAIVFSDSKNPLIVVQPGKMLTFTDVELKNFKFSYISLGEGSRILFDDKTRIELIDTEAINTTFTFKGETIIDGANNALIFYDHGAIELHSSIKFQDIILYGVSGTQLSGWDDNSTMTFQRVELYLDDSFTLTKGHIEILDWLDLTGSATFIYNTNKQSIIWEHGTFTVYTTFHYDPPIANRDLIKFVDDRSILALNGGTLSSTTTGMRLMGGKLLIQNDSYMENFGAVAISEGVELGDGVDQTNDCLAVFDANCNFNIVSGIFTYNNVALE
jgi:hypothetical protein